MLQQISFHIHQITNSNGNKMVVDLTHYIIVTELMNSETVMKYVEQYLDSKGQSHEHINPTIRSKIIFGVAAIMKQLHQNRIIFRDLKLEKLVLDENFEPKLLHNKLAKFVYKSKENENGNWHSILHGS